MPMSTISKSPPHSAPDDESPVPTPLHVARDPSPRRDAPPPDSPSAAPNPPHLCEGCAQPHDGTYGSGRFCTVHCARRIAASRKWEKQRTQRKRLATNVSADREQSTSSLSSASSADQPCNAKRRRVRTMHAPMPCRPLPAHLANPPYARFPSPLPPTPPPLRVVSQQPANTILQPQPLHYAQPSLHVHAHAPFAQPGAHLYPSASHTPTPPPQIHPYSDYAHSYAYGAQPIYPYHAQMTYTPPPYAVYSAPTPPPPPPPTPAPGAAESSTVQTNQAAGAANKPSLVSSKRECETVAEALLCLRSRSHDEKELPNE